MSDQKEKPPVPLEVHDLTVSYHKRPVLWGVDVEVPVGQLVGIIGPNGAGKSTLIKAAMGMLPLDSGWVKIFGSSGKESQAGRVCASTRIGGLGFSGECDGCGYDGALWASWFIKASTKIRS